MGTPNKYNKEYAKKAEEILATGKSLAAVCAHFGIARSTLYEWRNNHAEFRDSLDCGIQKCQAYWEDIGMDGIRGNYEKFGASSWIFTMKNRFRDDYKEDKEPKAANESLVEKLIERLID